MIKRREPKPAKYYKVLTTIGGREVCASGHRGVTRFREEELARGCKVFQCVDRIFASKIPSDQSPTEQEWRDYGVDWQILIDRSEVKEKDGQLTGKTYEGVKCLVAIDYRYEGKQLGYDPVKDQFLLV